MPVEAIRYQCCPALGSTEKKDKRKNKKYNACMDLRAVDVEVAGYLCLSKLNKRVKPYWWISEPLACLNYCFLLFVFNSFEWLLHLTWHMIQCDLCWLGGVYLASTFNLAWTDFKIHSSGFQIYDEEFRAQIFKYNVLNYRVCVKD